MIAEQIQVALQRLDNAYQTYRPVALFGLNSGGHDSFCASYIASLHPACSGIVHINTGTGIAATRQYVVDTCKQRNWKLIEYHAKENVRADGKPDPQDYAEIVRRHGFPGGPAHQFMYIRLKERALARLARDYGANCRPKIKKRIMLVSGARSQESVRRMGHTEEIQIDGRRIWVAPIHDWSKLDTTLCLEHVGQPRNEVVDLIHRSGECNCGAYAEAGELQELSMWPQTRPTYDAIMALQAEVKPIHGWGWGEKPLKKQPVGQPSCQMMLCWSCTKAP